MLVRTGVYAFDNRSTFSLRLVQEKPYTSESKNLYILNYILCLQCSGLCGPCLSTFITGASPKLMY